MLVLAMQFSRSATGQLEEPAGRFRHEDAGMS
jgi:hypothetical protein